MVKYSKINIFFIALLLTLSINLTASKTISKLKEKQNCFNRINYGGVCMTAAEVTAKIKAEDAKKKTQQPKSNPSTPVKTSAQVQEEQRQRGAALLSRPITTTRHIQPGEKQRRNRY